MKIRATASEEHKLFSVYPMSADVNYPQYKIARSDGYPFDQIFLVSDGGGVINLAGDTYVLEKGDLFYLKAGVPHEYHGDEDFATTYISYGGDGVFGLREYYAQGEFKLYKGKSTAAFEKNVKKIFEGFDSVSDIPALCALTYTTVIGFFEEACKKSFSSIESVHNYIEENYPFPLNLDDISTVYSSSKSKLCRDFKLKYGVTVFERLTEIRLTHARNILGANPSIKLRDVAASCGFNDVSYFCKMYRKVFGVSAKANSKHI